VPPFQVGVGLCGGLCDGWVGVLPGWPCSISVGRRVVGWVAAGSGTRCHSSREGLVRRGEAGYIGRFIVRLAMPHVGEGIRVVAGAQVQAQGAAVPSSRARVVLGRCSGYVVRLACKAYVEAAGC
jgi:hypothetical protein